MMRETHIKGIQLLAAGFTLRLSTDTAYDRQLLAEHLSVLLRRHGAVRLKFGRRAWWLTLTAGKAGHCAQCLRPLERAVRFADGELACVVCAARSVISAPGENKRSAA